jgi:pilus assembly protein FimV
LSALGRPLNAEIEIMSLQPGEADGLAARLASPEAFKEAGIEFNPALLGLRLSIERRSGRAFLKLSSAQAVNEPFLEMLVELQWNTGRLVREYTFLLDPPEYKGPQAIAAAPAMPAQPVTPQQPVAPAQAAAPAQPVAPTEPPAAVPAPEAAPPPQAAPTESQAPAATAEPTESPPLALAPEPSGAPAATPIPAVPEATYEVKKGDTLGAIARQHLAPGVTLEQMLIAIYRANQDAFIRDNINLVRAGRILNIPADSAGTVDVEDAKRLVKAHRADFNAYRSRLAAAAAAAEGTPGRREVAGRIEPKPEAVAPQDKQDQLRLSKADPAKPSEPGGRAAREDDQLARERALKEAQSRQTELEKNVADLQKLLELKNQQLAELEKRAGKPAAVPPVPAPKGTEKPAAPAAEAAKPAPAPAAKPAEIAKPAAVPAAKAPEAAKPAAEPPKPAAEAPKPAAEAPKPAGEAPKPGAETPKPSAEPAKPAAETPKPKPAAEAPKKAAPPPPPEPSVIDEFLDNPLALGALGGVLLLLVGYGAWAWSRKKRSQAKFQDSVLDAASGAGASSVFGAPASSGAPGPTSSSHASVSQAPSGMEAEEVDPIAEADVYMAYGRDAQAEEILREAVQKDPNRTTVHAKLLEIYANRKDAKSFEQSALKLKSLTGGAGPDWDKAAALGRSIDPQNGLYGAKGAAAPVAAPVAAPTLDFDLGGASTQGVPDITFADTEAPKADAASIDFDLGAAAAAPAKSAEQSDFTPEGTLIMGREPDPSASGGLDFDIGLPSTQQKSAAAPAAAADVSGGLDFDLNLDMDGDKGAAKPAALAPSMDLSSISLDLGGASDTAGSGAGSDPKWQEVATKLDLAKAYEEMGDKDGARELLGEVMKDGDSAQKNQAQQLLSKLG